MADSQPLFWVDAHGVRFLSGVHALVHAVTPRAAYIGASNGDKAEFYSIFQAAMEQVGISDCRMIPSAPSPDDRSFLLASDVILLSGGDVETGWKVMKENGVGETLISRHNSGAILIGVSAGAVHLGQVGWRQTLGSQTDLFTTFGLVPFIVSVHQEDQDWHDLKSLVTFMGDNYCGIGIPTGGAAVYYPDNTLQPVRHPIYEFRTEDSRITASFLIPGEKG